MIPSFCSFDLVLLNTSSNQNFCCHSSFQVAHYYGRRYTMHLFFFIYFLGYKLIMSHSKILATLNNIQECVPWIGEKVYIEIQFQHFSKNNMCVSITKNGQKWISIYCCSLIKGTRSYFFFTFRNYISMYQCSPINGTNF